MLSSVYHGHMRLVDAIDYVIIVRLSFCIGSQCLGRPKLKERTSKCTGFLITAVLWNEELNCAKFIVLQENTVFPF
jgi:hypothetical protein